MQDITIQINVKIEGQFFCKKNTMRYKISNNGCLLKIGTKCNLLQSRRGNKKEPKMDINAATAKQKYFVMKNRI